MTSVFAQNGGLSEQTFEAYNLCKTVPRVVRRMLDFYYVYLKDVAPLGLIIEHVPVEPDDQGRLPDRDPEREEIRLYTNSGKVFVSGLVSKEYDPRNLERPAGDEAYTHWLQGDFTPDGDNWRFFTGMTKIRFFSSRGTDGWVVGNEFHPIDQADEVAAFLQQEFNNLPFEARL